MTSATFPHEGPPFPMMSEQQWIVPPEVMDITVRIGCVRSSQHAQLAVSVHDETSRTLIAMGSIPHYWVVESRQVLTDLLEELLALTSRAMVGQGEL